MGYEPKDLTGSLFKNDRKESDRHPDYTGSVLIDGIEYWQSAWIKTDRNGNKYMSQSFKVKEKQNGGAPTQRSQPQPAFDTDLDDDVPFASCDPSLEWRVG